MLYIGGSGKLDWTVNGAPGATLSSASDVYDGLWHMAVATVCPPSACTAAVNAADEANGTAPGTYLYLDGQQVPGGWNSNTSVANLSGYWQFGTLPANYTALTDQPQGGANFLGYMGRDAVLPNSLTAQQVAALYGDSFGGLGGGGGGSSAICLQDTADPSYGSVYAAYPNCQSASTAAQGGAPAEPATPLCSSNLAGWGTAGGPLACVLAIAGGGGGGGFSTHRGPERVHGVHDHRQRGRGRRPQSSGRHLLVAAPAITSRAPATSGTPGPPPEARTASPPATGGAGPTGPSVCPWPRAGAGPASAAAKVAGPSRTAAGAAGPPGTPCPAPGNVRGHPPHQRAQHLRQPRDLEPSDNCAGFVSVTGPIVPPTGITLLASHIQPVGNVTWVPG